MLKILPQNIHVTKERGNKYKKAGGYQVQKVGMGGGEVVGMEPRWRYGMGRCMGVWGSYDPYYCMCMGATCQDGTYPTSGTT
jgi:hypothetical protein